MVFLVPTTLVFIYWCERICSMTKDKVVLNVAWIMRNTNIQIYDFVFHLLYYKEGLGVVTQPR